tara:strand:- start:4726 stop:5157 length:432 start_codon:yes stop_codon:yes gene_type:complete
MAYLICKDNGVYKIAANDSDKDDLNIPPNFYDIITISDSEFNNIRINNATVVVNGTSATVTEDTEKLRFNDKEELDSYLETVKFVAKSFLDVNVGHPKYSEVADYLSYLNNLDTSALSYPMLSSWEEYCNTNSITFLSTLQIP